MDGWLTLLVTLVVGIAGVMCQIALAGRRSREREERQAREFARWREKQRQTTKAVRRTLKHHLRECEHNHADGRKTRRKIYRWLQRLERRVSALSS